MTVAIACAAVLFLCQSASTESPRVDVRIDASEAEAVLRIVDARATTPDAAPDGAAPDWSSLFATEGYVRLKKREAAMGRAFEDAEFQRFVLSDDVRRRAADLRRTVDAWTHADLTAAANRALAYLPPDARLHATVYPMIKPRENSFVFETDSNPAIFLFLNPADSKEKFENTVAHELHHIGAGSLDTAYEERLKTEGLPADARAAARWMGAFAEGIAMLAAAGGPDVHPHAASPASDRERWDRDASNFASDLHLVERFFLDVLNHRLEGEEAVRKAASEFFGVQGPWYTVGWKMAVIVEQAYGRDAVIAAVADPRMLLVSYNRAVRERALGLPAWSDDVLTGVQAKRSRPPN